MLTYSFNDIPTIRHRLYQNILERSKSAFPIEDDNYSLVVDDIKYEGPESLTPESEKEYILSGYTAYRPLRGTLKLIDKKNNQVISEQRKRIAAVPYLTNRGTLIINGVEYGFTNQQRLRPGIYTRIRPTGEYEALVNTAEGVGHRYLLNPETGIFSVSVGQANIPLFPILTSLGVDPGDIVEAWGRDLYSANAAKTDTTAPRRFYKALMGTAPKDQEEIYSNLKEYINKLRFDPTVTSLTLGEPISEMSPSVILKATKKLLKASRGESPIDDRNHLGFLRTYGPEEIIPEYIKRSRRNLKKYFNSVRASRDVAKFPSGVFDKAINSAIYGSGLGQALTEINPIELLDTRFRATRLGEGGIPSKDMVTEDVRYLHPSHLGFIDPSHTPEGTNVGVDSRLSVGTVRDTEGNIYSNFKDLSTGKVVQLTPKELFNKVVTFPGELESGEKFVRAIINNQHVVVPRRVVDYQLASSESLYGPLSNLIPLKQNNYGQRISMGARMLTQAVPLEESESPLVQNKDSNTGKAFDEIYGRYFITTSPVNGKVVSVSKKNIKIKDTNGNIVKIPYYRQFPFNYKTFFNETPQVRAGDTVTKSQPLTKSNFTNSRGELSLGRNLKTVYMPWEGLNFEDATVISESAAKKLRSEHLYQSWTDRTSEMVLNKDKFRSIFPGKFKKDFYEKYTPEGVVKPGTILEKNQPIALIASRVPSGATSSKRNFRDESPVWEHEDPGEVMDVVIGPKHINVIVKATHPTKVGDKLAGRYGDKNIIADIIPDEKMPKDENGEPYEIILNPEGVKGRGNISQIWELLLGKVAKKTGSPVVVEDYKYNMIPYVREQLEKHGLRDKDPVRIDKYNKTLNLPTGYRYMQKLHHMAEAKLSGRGTGTYSSEDIPSKGGFEGAKRVGLLEMLGILAHGAYNVSRDARTVRGQKNQDFWDRVMLGYDLPKLTEKPFIYNKFIEQLRAIGLNPSETKDRLHLFALTNSAIKDLTKDRVITNPATAEVRDNKLVAIPGGLFDSKLTGGFNGNLWTAIDLPEPMPNPIMEDVIRNILGLTQKDYVRILAGASELPEYGKGPQAIKKALSDIDIDGTIQYEEKRIPDLKGNNLNISIKRVKALRALKQNKVKPEDLFWDRFPVLPPAYRTAGIMSTTKLPLIADPNYLYKDLLEISQNNKLLKKEGLLDPQDRLLLYKAMKAVIGFGDSINPKYKAQNIKGILPQIIGSSPKEGVVQKKLLGAQTDLVGRAVITPNPNLGLDEVGIPEAAAWNIYKPFIVRRLVREGVSKLEALQSIKDKDARAKKALLAEMEDRPVLISRAPVLHKYGVMAAWPKLTTGNTMEIHPFTVGGYGADFDGDTMQFHVPADPNAVNEAIERMLPSKNILSLRNFQAHYTPSHEYLGGLYYLSNQKAEGAPMRFRTRDEMITALKEGRITPNQRVIIEEE